MKIGRLLKYKDEPGLKISRQLRKKRRAKEDDMLTNLNKDEQGNKIERTLGKTKASQAKRRADYLKLGRVRIRKEDGWTFRRNPSNKEVHGKKMVDS